MQILLRVRHRLQKLLVRESRVKLLQARVLLSVIESIS